MSALPVDPPQQQDPLDPERILRALPDRERETFLAEYRLALVLLARARGVPAGDGPVTGGGCGWWCGWVLARPGLKGPYGT